MSYTRVPVFGNAGTETEGEVIKTGSPSHLPETTIQTFSHYNSQYLRIWSVDVRTFQHMYMILKAALLRRH